jgi:hypothetical protein
MQRRAGTARCRVQLTGRPDAEVDVAQCQRFALPQGETELLITRSPLPPDVLPIPLSTPSTSLDRRLIRCQFDHRHVVPQPASLDRRWTPAVPRSGPYDLRLLDAGRRILASRDRPLDAL